MLRCRLRRARSRQKRGLFDFAFNQTFLTSETNVFLATCSRIAESMRTDRDTAAAHGFQMGSEVRWSYCKNRHDAGRQGPRQSQVHAQKRDRMEAVVSRRLTHDAPDRPTVEDRLRPRGREALRETAGHRDLPSLRCGGTAPGPTGTFQYRRGIYAAAGDFFG